METITLNEFEEGIEILSEVGNLIYSIDELEKKETKIEWIEYSIMRLNNLKKEIENEKV